MRLGVFTPLLSHLPLEDALATLKSLQIDAVELGTGNYPGDAHCKLSMLEDASALKEFQQKLKDHGIFISALSCHGNALHPQQALAEKAREVSRKTILLAEKLGVSTVVDFSGCPGDSHCGAVAELGDVSVAAGVSGPAAMAMGRGGHSLLDAACKVRGRSRRENRH